MKKDRRKKRGVDVTVTSGISEAIQSLHEARLKPVKQSRAMLARMVEESRGKAGAPKRGQQELDFRTPR